MKVGDLVLVIENDMSKVIRQYGPKDNLFFGQIGMIIDRPRTSSGRAMINGRWIVQFPAGLYQVQETAIKKITNMIPE